MVRRGRVGRTGADPGQGSDLLPAPEPGRSDRGWPGRPPAVLERCRPGFRPCGRGRQQPQRPLAQQREPDFTDAIIARSTSKGKSEQATLSLTKPFNDSDWSWLLAYTYTNATDVSPLTSSTSGSQWGNSIRFNPNDEVSARSSYEITNRVTAALSWKHAFFGDYDTSASMFYEGRSAPVQLHLRQRRQRRRPLRQRPAVHPVGSGRRAVRHACGRGSVLGVRRRGFLPQWPPRPACRAQRRARRLGQPVRRARLAATARLDGRAQIGNLDRRAQHRQPRTRSGAGSRKSPSPVRAAWSSTAAWTRHRQVCYRFNSRTTSPLR